MTVHLPPRVEEELKAYCVSRRVTKSAAVKEALEQLMSESTGRARRFELGKGGFGVDDSAGGDVARNTKRLIKDGFVPRLVADLIGEPHIPTVDQRDFTAFRLKGRKRFNLVCRYRS